MSNIIQYGKNEARKLLPAFVVILLLLIISPVLLILLCGIIATYKYLDNKFTNDLIGSRLLLGLIALFTYLGFVTLLIIVASSFIDIPLFVVAILSTVFSIVLAKLYRPAEHKVSNRKLYDKADVVSLILVAITALAVFVMPLYESNVFENRSNALVLVTGNVDFSPHIGMFNDYIDLGTTRPWDHVGHVRNALGGFYPSSWHAANAIVAKSIFPSISAGATSTVVFACLHIFWILALVYLSSRVSLLLYGATVRDKRSTVPLVAITLLMITAIYFFVINLARFGYFSYIPQLLSALILVYCLRQAIESGFGRSSMVSLCIFYCALSLATWILLLPVFAASLIIVLCTWFGRNKKRLSWSSIRADLQYNAMLYALTTASVLAQTILIKSDDSAAAVPFLKGILLDGGVTAYDHFLYLFLFVGLAYVIYTTKKLRPNDRTYEPILIMIACTVGLSIILFLIQTYLTGELHYYYYKVLLLLPILLTPASAAALGLLVARINKKDGLLAVTMAFLVPSSFVLFGTTDASVMSYIHGTRAVSSSVNQSIFYQLNNPEDKKITLYMVDDVFPSDIASLLSQSNRPYSDCMTDLRTSKLYATKFIDAVRNLKDDTLPVSCADKSVEIIVSPSLKKYIDGIQTRNFKITVLDK